MQICSVSPVCFCGLGSKILSNARARDSYARRVINEAAELRHPEDRATFRKEHWDKYLNERCQTTHRPVDMKKVLEPTEHDKAMDRNRNRR
jgi:hypothetical protein